MKLGHAAAACLTCAALVVAAEAVKTQPLNVKLGLWQMTYRYASPNSSTVPRELLAKMTPQQRARVAAKLKARAAQGPRVDTRQFCLTQDRLDNANFVDDTHKSCGRTVIASTSKLQQFQENCNDNGIQTTVDARIEALDAKSVKASFDVKAGGSYGSSTALELDGKFLAADCGANKNN